METEAFTAGEFDRPTGGRVLWEGVIKGLRAPELDTTARVVLTITGRAMCEMSALDTMGARSWIPVMLDGQELLILRAAIQHRIPAADYHRDLAKRGVTP